MKGIASIAVVLTQTGRYKAAIEGAGITDCASEVAAWLARYNKPSAS